MDVLAFWLAAVVTWALALPLAASCLRRLPDAGAGLALPLGLIVAGLAYFLLRVASAVPAGDGGWLCGLLVLGLVSGLVLRNDRHALPALNRAKFSALAMFGLFSALFFAFTWFRSHVSAIVDTEQPMDFMYLNAMLASPDYPPHDAWYAGESASYYYFGYLQMALLTAVSGVPASSGYTFALAATFAAAGTGVASLAIALVRWTTPFRQRFVPMGAAVLGMLMLLAAGSLSAPFEWAAAHGHTDETLYRTFGVQWMIPCDEADAATGNTDCYTGQLNPRTNEWYPTEYWFWWRGTRIIPDTITEFPFFSFLLGDLHPHVMAIPPVLLAIGLCIATWRGRSALSFDSHRRPWTGLLFAAVFGALAFINAWDLITFCALLAVVVAARNVRALGNGPGMVAAAGWFVPVIVAAIALYLPWYLTFSSQADGVYPYIGKGTIPAHAFLQFGMPLLLALCVAPFALRGRAGAAVDALAAGLWVPLLPLLAWLGFAAVRGELTEAVQSRTGFGWITLLVYAGVAWVLASGFWLQLTRRQPLVLVTGLGALGALLLYGTELFYIGDIFKGFIPRQNTVFKLSYQAWIVLSVVGPAALLLGLGALAQGQIRLRVAGFLALPAVGLLGAALVYPVLALPNRTDSFRADTHTDGLAFLAISQPDEYAVVRWVEEHTALGDVVVEGSGRSYIIGADGAFAFNPNGPRIDYGEPGRISARTGRATPIGWSGHEAQWRGTGPEVGAEIARRQDLVDSLYLADSPETVLGRMRELGAAYVVVGRVERERYPVDIDATMVLALDLVFESGTTRIYAMPRSWALETA